MSWAIAIGGPVDGKEYRFEGTPPPTLFAMNPPTPLLFTRDEPGPCALTLNYVAYRLHQYRHTGVDLTFWAYLAPGIDPDSYETVALIERGILG